MISSDRQMMDRGSSEQMRPRSSSASVIIHMLLKGNFKGLIILTKSHQKLKTNWLFYINGCAAFANCYRRCKIPWHEGALLTITYGQEDKCQDSPSHAVSQGHLEKSFKNRRDAEGFKFCSNQWRSKRTENPFFGSKMHQSGRIHLYSGVSSAAVMET